MKQIDTIKLLTQNEKMKKSIVSTLNFCLPAGLCCPNAGKCAEGCYGRGGWYGTHRVYKRALLRYEVARSRAFIDVMGGELTRAISQRIRLHDSGDFYSESYLDKWMYLMKYFPDKQFYTYTKMVSLIKSIKMPKNFTAIYSYGGTEDHLIDPEIDRHAIVFPNATVLGRVGYTNASLKDDYAIGNSKKVGLVYHGLKKFDNTNWSEIRMSI